MAINVLGRNAILGLGDEDLDEDADRLDIPIHAFDLIVADECHRGYTSQELSVWRSTLDHFDAVKIGLTATPAAHTTSYFRDIVFRYEYERAVREWFLVDYDAVAIRSDVRMRGVFLDEGEQVGVVDTQTGAQRLDLLEDERQFNPGDVERRVTSPDSNRKIVEELKKHALQHEREWGRFPKTLIFADNDLPHTSHADQLVDICRDVFGCGDSFVTKITGRVDRPLQRIREFRNRPTPAIAVTVDLLSTGVDIPDLEFIVFLRTVRSRILFEQMLGRGTRKGDHYPDKSLHGLRLFRRHPARVLPAGHRYHCRAPDAAHAQHPGDRRGHLGQPRPRLQPPLRSSSGCSASTSRWRRRHGRCSPRSSRTATSAASPARCRAA